MSVIKGKRFIEFSLNKEDERHYYRQLYNFANSISLTLEQLRILDIRKTKPLKLGQLKNAVMQAKFDAWKANRNA